MPIDTLREQERLRVRYHRLLEVGAEEATLERALRDLNKAEEAHLDAIHVERSPGIWGTFLGATIVLAMIIGLVLIWGLAGDTRQNTEGIAAQQIASVVDQREACERLNDSRVASIEKERRSIRNLAKQLAFWNAALAANPEGLKATPAPLARAFLGLVGGLRDEIANKREGIRQSIASQVDVAVRPGSPVADCAKAYPFEPSADEEKISP